MNRAFLVALTAVALITGVLLTRHELALSSYKAFYCAGHVALSGANPYLVEPLRSCEHTLVTDPGFPAKAVEPAPLPPYTIVMLMALGMPGIGASHMIFTAVLVLSLAITALALSSITRLPSALLLAGCASLWFTNVSYGELPPITVVFLALCALALEKKRPALAGLCAAAAMIQPHVALPVCVALFLLVPGTRVALIACALALAGLGTILGPHVAAAYFTTYLPIHAASEIPVIDQYSLTHVLHALGAGENIALRAGTAMYVVMAAGGVLCARPLAQRLEMPALVALTPPAFVLLGGTFVHDIQMFAALPLAFVLLARTSRSNAALALSAVLLCVEWQASGSRLAFGIALLSAAAAAYIVFEDRSRAWIRIVATTLCVAAALVLINRIPPRQYVTTGAGVTAASGAPASVAWGQLIRTTPFLSEDSAALEARKIPTWLGLICLISAAIAQRKTESEVEIAEPAPA